MDRKRALITGITGQDGSYLAELLLDKGYEVHGIVRRMAFERSDDRISRIIHIKDRVTLHPASLESFASIYRVITKVQPHERYHLAAQSFVSYSFEDEFSTYQTNITGTHHVLAALKDAAPKCKVYFAGTSEMFGEVEKTPQDEHTRFHPRSPYGVSKTAGFYMVQNYREACGMFAVSGILFNHESPRRGLEFVTRKITNAVVRIKLGRAKELCLGNLDAKRDWGYAGDYVKAMWSMLQQERPVDYVIATGTTHSVGEFVEEAFSYAGLDWKEHVVIDDAFKRPAEVHLLQGDASKAAQELGWKPKVGFRELVRMMVKSDIEVEAFRGRR